MLSPKNKNGDPSPKNKNGDVVLHDRRAGIYGKSTALRVDGSPMVNSCLRFNVAGVGASSISQVQSLI
jgi:hypothetical protein